MSDVLKEINEMFDELLKEVDKRTLGDKLKEKRIADELTVEDVAWRSGLSKSFIEKIENDEIKDINISTLKRLSTTYEISINVFISHLGSN